MSRLQDVILRDTRANQPAIGDVAPGTIFYVTDEAVTERAADDLSAWEDISDAGAVSGITQLTGDVTAGPGTGSQAATLANTAVTPGSYTTADITVDSKGRLTAAASGAAVAVRRQVTVVIDGGASAITTGIKAYLSMPVGGTWKKWRILSTVSGSIVIDVWKDTYANYPPTVADTITASDKPTISSATKAEGSSLTGWTTTFSAGDVLGFNVDSITTCTKIVLTLEYE